MRRTLLAVALAAMLGTASAQLWGLGVQYRFGGDATANLTLEFPAVDLLGVRAGPSVSTRAHAGPDGYGAAVLAGVTLAFVPSVPGVTAIMLEVNYEVLLRSGEAARYGPTIGLYLSGSW